jgi:sec-independent protein translocase protein TatA
LLVLAALGLLFFGSNLPKLGRSLGKTIVEFRRGVSGIEDDLEASSGQPEAPSQPPPARPPERLTPPAPKFEDTDQKEGEAEQPPSV